MEIVNELPPYTRRAVCPVCNGDWAVRLDGTLRRHGTPWCDGSEITVCSARQAGQERAALERAAVRENREALTAKRTREATEWLAAGLTLDEIGERWGVTRQAVSIWLDRHGFKDPTATSRAVRNAATAQAAAAEHEARKAAVSALTDAEIAEMMTMTTAQIAERLGFRLTVALQRQVWGGVRIGSYRPQGHVRLTLAQVIRYHRAAAQAAGVPPESLGPTQYRRIAAELGFPSDQLMFSAARRLGTTMEQVRILAGGTTSETVTYRRDYRKFGKADALAVVRQFRTESADWTYHAYMRWEAARRAAGKRAYNRWTILHAFGATGWNEMLAVALVDREIGAGTPITPSS